MPIVGVLIAAALLSPVLAQPPQPGMLPPLDWNLRARLYTRKFTTFQSAFDTVPGALFNHGINSPESWGQGGDGFARRLGSTYGQYAARETIELAMFAIRKEDPRYVRLGSGSFGRRVGRVLKSAVIARDLQGRDTLAVGAIVGVFGGRAVAVSWLPPEKQTTSSVMISGGYGLLTRAAGNAFREFWPDIWRR